MTPRVAVRVRSITYEAHDIYSYELVAISGGSLPAFDAGAHIDVCVPGGAVRQYSICSDSTDNTRYVIAVLKESRGRGGSLAMHAHVRPGDELTISEPRNNFPLVANASKYVMIAGGIGVTPLLGMVRRLALHSARIEFYYCVRSPERAAFRSDLHHLVKAGSVVEVFDGGNPARGLNVRELLSSYDSGTHLYCCGPPGLMEAVRQASGHWPSGFVHFEYFSPAVPPGNVSTEANSGFEVELARSGARLTVGPDQSIVQALRSFGVQVETSCEAGTCGTCRTRYLAGSPIHNDYVLSDEERQAELMICCARAHGGVLVLDL